MFKVTKKDTSMLLTSVWCLSLTRTDFTPFSSVFFCLVFCSASWKMFPTLSEFYETAATIPKFGTYYKLKLTNSKLSAMQIFL